VGGRVPGPQWIQTSATAQVPFVAGQSTGLEPVHIFPYTFFCCCCFCFFIVLLFICAYKAWVISPPLPPPPFPYTLNHLCITVTLMPCKCLLYSIILERMTRKKTLTSPVKKQFVPQIFDPQLVAPWMWNLQSGGSAWDEDLMGGLGVQFSP
jgi:hypothetical protein